MNDIPLTPWQLAAHWPNAGTTQAWWSLLCAVALVNMLGWLASAALLGRRSAQLPAPAWGVVRLQLLLSAGYVLGCGYRSVFPVYDIARLSMVDSWLSSVMVGRSVATVAELCFAAQWALLLRSVAQATDSPLGVQAARLVLPMIAVAELCSWYAVLTTSNLGHVFEETLWGISALVVVAGLVRLSPRCRPTARPALAIASLVGLAYAVYMFEVDVPMYWARWVNDTAHARPVLSVAQGLADAATRWVVSHNWADWQSEVVWMSLYFSVAVWFSIALAHFSARHLAHGAPAPAEHPAYLQAPRFGKHLNS